MARAYCHNWIIINQRKRLSIGIGDVWVETKQRIVAHSGEIDAERKHRAWKFVLRCRLKFISAPNRNCYAKGWCPCYTKPLFLVQLQRTLSRTSRKYERFTDVKWKRDGKSKWPWLDACVTWIRTGIRTGNSMSFSSKSNRKTSSGAMRFCPWACKAADSHLTASRGPTHCNLWFVLFRLEMSVLTKNRKAARASHLLFAIHCFVIWMHFIIASSACAKANGNEFMGFVF